MKDCPWVGKYANSYWRWDWQETPAKPSSMQATEKEGPEKPLLYGVDRAGKPVPLMKSRRAGFVR